MEAARQLDPVKKRGDAVAAFVAIADAVIQHRLFDLVEQPHLRIELAKGSVICMSRRAGAIRPAPSRSRPVRQPHLARSRLDQPPGSDAPP